MTATRANLPSDLILKLQDLTPEITSSHKCHMNMGLILNGYGARVVFCCSYGMHVRARMTSLDYRSYRKVQHMTIMLIFCRMSCQPP
jgi:hypothetical protein